MKKLFIICLLLTACSSSSDEFLKDQELMGIYHHDKGKGGPYLELEDHIYLMELSEDLDDQWVQVWGDVTIHQCGDQEQCLIEGEIRSMDVDAFQLINAYE